MRTRSFADMKCSIVGALEHLGDRWLPLIIGDLMFGLSRFEDLQASSGIPPQTLTDRLHRLQAAKIIVKHQAPSARKGYELTEMGHDLLTVLAALRQWGDRSQLHGTNGPPLKAFDSQNSSPVELTMIATGTGKRISPGQLVLTPGPGADQRMRFQLRAGQPDQTTASPTSGRALLPVPNALPDEGLE